MRVTVRGIKARDVSVELDRLTLITGPNSSSKSTVAEAIRFAFLGHIPALGGSPAATAALMRGTEMSVDVELDDGRTIYRAMKNTGRALRGSVTASWLDAKTQGEPDVEILQLVGTDATDAAEVLDVRQLLRLPDNQRAARIERLLASASGAAALEQMIARYTVQRLTETPDDLMPDSPKGLQALQGTVPKAARSLVAAAWPTIKAKLTETSLPGVFEWVNGEKRTAKNRAEGVTKAKAALERRVAELRAPDDATITTLEAEREELDRAIGATEERATVAAKKRAAIIEADRAVHAAGEAHGEAKLDRARLKGAAAAGTVTELVEVEAALDALVAPAAPAELEHAAALDQEAAGCDALLATIAVPVLEDLKGWPAKLADLEAVVAGYDANPWQQVDDLAATIAMVASGKSSKDEMIRGHVTTIRQLAMRQLGDVAALRANAADNLERAKAQYVDAQQRLARETERCKAVVAERNEYASRARALREEAAEIRSAHGADYAIARAAYDTERTRLTERRDVLRPLTERYAKADADTAAALTRAQDTLAAAEQRRRDLGEPPPGDEERATQLARLEAVKTELEELRGAAAARAELDGLIAELEALTVARKTYEAIEWAVQRTRNEEVSIAARPLEAAMDRFFAGAGLNLHAFVRAGQGSCRFGWRLPQAVPDRRDTAVPVTPEPIEVPVQALGEAEWIVYTAAFICAMHSLRQAPLKILLVEAAGCDHAVLDRLLRGIAAVSDCLTTAVVASWHPPLKSIPGWKVIRFPEQTRTAAAA